jgi:2-hydroxy-3-keto-5-methylthiopentenyl-1-phosphate phosphatase
MTGGRDRLTCGRVESTTAVFVDFDGTITDIDTVDAMVRALAGDALAGELEADLEAGRTTVRGAFERQAAAMRSSRTEALAWVARNVRVDPTFRPFVAAVRASGATITVVSSGIESIIRDALARAGVTVDVLANDVDFAPGGWSIRFIDDSANAHDKAARVRAAHADGIRTVYIGDGISDFEAAYAADVRFAKRGRALEAYCARMGIAVTPFTSFDEIAARLWTAPPVAPCIESEQSP